MLPLNGFKTIYYSFDNKRWLSTHLIILIIPREPAMATIGSPESKMNDHAAV
jgi:hypothetical protein